MDRITALAQRNGQGFDGSHATTEYSAGPAAVNDTTRPPARRAAQEKPLVCWQGATLQSAVQSLPPP
jgi:hypothetical protein